MLGRGLYIFDLVVVLLVAIALPQLLYAQPPTAEEDVNGVLIEYDFAGITSTDQPGDASVCVYLEFVFKGDSSGDVDVSMNDLNDASVLSLSNQSRPVCFDIDDRFYGDKNRFIS